MLRPYRINNLKTGFIDPAKLNSTSLWNQSMTWLLGLLLSLRPQSLACMQTFKTLHKSLFRFSYHMCYWFPPFHLVNINASCFPLLFGTYGWVTLFCPDMAPRSQFFLCDDLFVFADKAGFGNNFTTGGDKSLVHSMETVVVGCMFKSLITRCASTTHELHSSENLVRVLHLTNYIWW